MVPPENRAAVFEALTRNIEQKSDGHVGTGLVGAQWLMRTLTGNGRPDVAYQIATRRPTPVGATWSRKAPRQSGSYGTATPRPRHEFRQPRDADRRPGRLDVRGLAGIRSDPERPGFQRVIIHPVPAGDLTFVKASHKSMYGTITTSWKRDAGHFTLEVTIPPTPAPW